jgi:hypothetical protein
LIPTPIRQVLLTFQKHGVQALLMGGQACVFYGAAQVSKDIDFTILADEPNYNQLHDALAELKADRIAIPRFDPAALARGHAVHYRCQAPGVEGMRVDVMTTMRGVSDFATLWERRTTFGDEHGAEFNLLSIPDLVQAKKTQRSKDWPVVELLAAIHHRENSGQPREGFIAFWLSEARTPELLIELARDYPSQAHELSEHRPLLNLAIANDIDALRLALDTERQAVQAIDRAYWEPLRKELEEFRKAERLS